MIFGAGIGCCTGGALRPGGERCVSGRAKNTSRPVLMLSGPAGPAGGRGQVGAENVRPALRLPAQVLWLFENPIGDSGMQALSVHGLLWIYSSLVHALRQKQKERHEVACTEAAPARLGRCRGVWQSTVSSSARSAGRDPFEGEVRSDGPRARRPFGFFGVCLRRLYPNFTPADIARRKYVPNSEGCGMLLVTFAGGHHEPPGPRGHARPEPGRHRHG